MATVNKHYDEVLSDVYSWMFGGFDIGVQKNIAFFDKYRLTPKGSRLAVDLGSGCGFQSIPLAKLGYSVTAIDLDSKLLSELKSNSKNLQITPVQNDLIDFDEVIEGGIELVVCMTDTLLHLESKEKVISLFSKVHAALEPEGKFIITFRDLTIELIDMDRFLPVKSDGSTIFTCFLEYEFETVKVHDIVYKKNGVNWKLFKSFYRKLRLSKEWVIEQLSQCNFNKIDSSVDNGVITIIVQK